MTWHGIAGNGLNNITCPVWPLSLSMDCLPNMIKSTFSFCVGGPPTQQPTTQHALAQELLAQNKQAYLSNVLEHFGDGQRLKLLVRAHGRLYVYAAVCTHRKSCPQGLLARLGSDGEGDDLGGHLLLLQSDGLLCRDRSDS